MRSLSAFQSRPCAFRHSCDRRMAVCQAMRHCRSAEPSLTNMASLSRREWLSLAAIIVATPMLAAQAEEAGPLATEAASTSAPSEVRQETRTSCSICMPSHASVLSLGPHVPCMTAHCSHAVFNLVSAPQEFSTLSDDILAYRFSYPVTLEGRRLPIIASRKPERYSSAAPLTADARQRIVAELVSFPDTITISMSVGARWQPACRWARADSLLGLHRQRVPPLRGERGGELLGWLLRWARPQAC